MHHLHTTFLFLPTVLFLQLVTILHHFYSTITDNVHVLLQTNREWFTAQLKAALDKGWTTWATQVAELHKLNEKKAEASTSSMRKALRNTRGPCAGLSYASGPPLRGTHAAVGRFRGKSRRHFSLANGDQK